jgi:hypothetical protein
MSLLAAPLPGLYLALLAFLLDRALRRWWDPVPVRVWGAFGLLLVILFGPSLFLGRVLIPADILPGVAQPEDARKPPQGNRLQVDLVTQIVPLQAQVRRALRAGEWPLWNDLAGAGMPLMADPQSQTLEPLVLLALPLPLPAAVGVTAGLRVLTALVFFFLLLRRQGLSEGPALFGSLSFGLGGFLLLWLSWPIGSSPALLPLVLYALAITADRGARRDFLLLILALFSLLVAGHPETIVYVAIVGGLFALSRLVRHPSRAGLLARWVLAGAIAFGLAAPTLIPTFRFLPQSLRHHWVELRNERLEQRDSLFGDEMDGLQKRAVAVFAPNAWGNSRYGHYWGESNTNEDSSAFAGSAALLAALLAFLPAARRFPQERLFLVLAPVSLLIAVRVPGVPRLLSELPVLNQSISSNRRLLLVVGFCLAWLGACTIERWRARQGPGKAAVLAGGLALIVLIAWGYLLSADLEALRSLRWFWMGSQIAVVAGSAFLLILRSPSSPGEGGREGTGEEGRGGEGPGGGSVTWPMWVLCAIAAIELIVFHAPANPSVPRRAYYPETPAFRFLQENARDSRIAGLGNRIYPNAAAIYGLADVRISNPLKPFPYVQAVAPVSTSIRATEHILKAPDHPLYQLFGVRWVVAQPRVASIPGLRLAFHDPTARIFERTQVLPRLFLPESAESPGARRWPAWLAANPDFAARALVPSSPGRPADWTAAHPAGSRMEIRSLEPERLTADAHLTEERLLASSIYQDGGWHLLLDGRPFPAGTANGPFLAAWLPAGEHRLEWVYRAPGFLPGLGLAAVALAGTAAWLFSGFGGGHPEVGKSGGIRGGSRQGSAGGNKLRPAPDKVTSARKNLIPARVSLRRLDLSLFRPE